MSASKHDHQIMTRLNNSKTPLSAYMITQETGLYITQTKPRLRWLTDNGVLIETNGSRTKEYDLHPALNTKKQVKEMTELINDLSLIINETQNITPDGLKTILGFLITRIRFVKEK